MAWHGLTGMACKYSRSNGDTYTWLAWHGYLKQGWSILGSGNMASNGWIYSGPHLKEQA